MTGAVAPCPEQDHHSRHADLAIAVEVHRAGRTGSGNDAFESDSDGFDLLPSNIQVHFLTQRLETVNIALQQPQFPGGAFHLIRQLVDVLTPLGWCWLVWVLGFHRFSLREFVHHFGWDIRKELFHF